MSGSTVFHRNLRQHLVSRRMRGWNFVYLCASVVTLHPLLGDGVMSAMLLLKLNADELCSKLAVFKVKLKSNIIIWPTLSEVSNTRSSAAADGPRDALSVKILSTVETTCTKNPQQIAVMQLEGYSRPTCSKQHFSFISVSTVIYGTNKWTILHRCCVYIYASFVYACFIYL